MDEDIFTTRGRKRARRAYRKATKAFHLRVKAAVAANDRDEALAAIRAYDDEMLRLIPNPLKGSIDNA